MWLFSLVNLFHIDLIIKPTKKLSRVEENFFLPHTSLRKIRKLRLRNWPNAEGRCCQHATLILAASPLHTEDLLWACGQGGLVRPQSHCSWQEGEQVHGYPSFLALRWDKWGVSATLQVRPGCHSDNSALSISCLPFLSHFLTLQLGLPEVTSQIAPCLQIPVSGFTCEGLQTKWGVNQIKT